MKLVAKIILILILINSAYFLMGENLVKNGGFEEISGNLPTMWTTNTWKSNEDAVKFYVESTGAHSGQFFASIQNDVAEDSKYIQYINVKTNSVYKLSGWISAEGIGRDYLGANLSVLRILETSRDFKETNNNWEYTEIYGITGPKQTELAITLRLGGYGNINTGKASFDDISLEELDDFPEGVDIVNFFESDAPSHPKDPTWDPQNINGYLPSTFIFSLLFTCLFFLCYYYFFRKDKLADLKINKTLLFFRIFLFAAFVFRLILAPVIEGYPTDIACFKGWGALAANNGLSEFYNSEVFVDYLPGYIYVLFIIGKIQSLFSLPYHSDVFLILIKLPAMIADIISAYLIFKLCRKKIRPLFAALLGLLYVFNPAVIINSTIYGQIDSFFSLFILLIVYYFFKGKQFYIISSALLALAIIIKPQALIISPLGLFFIIGVLWRLSKYINNKFIKKTDTETADIFENIQKDLKIMGLCLLSFAASSLVLILPMMKNPLKIFDLLNKTFGNYPYASLNAFNIYSLFGGNWYDISNSFFIFSYGTRNIFIISSIILLPVILFSGYIFFKSRNKAKPFYITLFLFAAVFMLCIEMHERYLFPALILAIFSYTYTRDRRFLYIFAGFSILIFFNQAMVLDFMINGNTAQIPANDGLLRLFSLINLIFFIYLVKIIWDISINENILTINSKAFKIKTTKDDSLEKIDARMLAGKHQKPLKLKNRDYTLIGSLTLIYAIIAFVNLGSLKAPQTYWNPRNSNESFYVDLGRVYEIQRVYYFLGMGEGSYKLEFSNNGTDWESENEEEFHEGYKQEENEQAGNEHELSIVQESKYGMVEWRYFKTHHNARYIKIMAINPGVMLNEVGFFAGDSLEPIPIKSIVNINSAQLKNSGLPDNVFDEQDTIHYIPSYFNGMYFDEVYHARTAYEHLHSIYPTETTHPPLGKLIIAVGIFIFDMTPFGWRFMGTLIGVIMIPIMYLFIKRIFKRTEYAFFGSFLFAFDFMHFVQTRIATIDVYGVFFIILMYYFMYEYYELSFYDTDMKQTLKPLLYCGICLGLGVACKWIVIYAAAGIALLLFICMGQRINEYLKAKDILNSKKDIRKKQKRRSIYITEVFKGKLFKTLGFCVLVFIVVPCFIYFLSYLPILLLPGVQGDISFVIEDQINMYNYHANLEATHAFSSMWWEWPIMKTPIWYFGGMNYLPPDKVSNIVALGNPAIWLVGILAVLATIALTIIRKHKAMLFILIALFFQYLPWIIIPRKLVFIYHYFPTVPFMIICIIYILFILQEMYPWFKYASYIYLGIVLLLFIFVYPILSGMVVDKGYMTGIQELLRFWPFYL